MIKRIFFFIGLITTITVGAQVPSFKTSIDRSTILIGQQFHLKLEVSIPHNTFTLQSLSIPDSIPHFEILGKGKSDSVPGDAVTYFSQILNITSFDSGTFVLPAFKINFVSLDKGKVFSGLTDTFRVNVGYSKIDSVMPFHDIHTVINVKDQWELWQWLALMDAILLLIAIILFIIRLLKKKKKIEVFASSLTPYDEAIKGLSELQSQRLLENGNTKQFHTTLVDIFKRFLSRKVGKDITSLTSNETLVLLQQQNISKEEISRAANTLRMSDAVKFAKYNPSINDSNVALSETKETIETINKSNSQQAIS